MTVMIPHLSTYPHLTSSVPTFNKEMVTGWDQSWVSLLTASVRREIYIKELMGTVKI